MPPIRSYNNWNTRREEKEIEPILKNVEEIKYKLNWEYKDISLSTIEGKTSVSNIKAIDTLKDITEFKINNMKTPEFLKEKTNRLSGAQKGTLVHLCMQNLNIKEDYTYEKINDLIEELLFRKKISNIEAENIDINKILEFTKSKLWEELKNAKLVEREKAFYISIPVDEIYGNNIKEEILVQGIIDLYYINKEDELVLVDYKTDYVSNEQELVQKYSKQLELYKRALEEALSRKVINTYIYSTYLNKEILI